MSTDIIQACVVAGLVAYVSETFTSMAMNDPRLLRQLDGMEEAIMDELRFLEALQPSVWIHLASTTNSAGWVLRDEVMRGALASAAHLERNIFWELSFLRLRSILRQESCEQALLEIESLPDLSEDPVVAKLQALSHLKFSRESLLTAISLLQSVSFSSHFTERQHASTASLKRLHDYGHATLCPRAFVHVFR